MTENSKDLNVIKVNMDGWQFRMLEHHQQRKSKTLVGTLNDFTQLF
jgi:hypothetical protein